jgi:phosphatidate cytidylyltransferase
LRSDLPADIPGEPAQPEIPGEPPQPENPGERPQPEILSEPPQPENPGERPQPEILSEPPQPVIPGEPPQQESPGEPAQPEKPEKPGEPAQQEKRGRRTGRNLPAAVLVGLVLGGLAILTLFTVKATFLAFVAVVICVALWELTRAVAERQVGLPVIPVAAGGVVALVLSYWKGERAALACITLTVMVILAWRLAGGAAGYLRDVTAGTFALCYLPLPACFVGLMLAPHDGPKRTLVFLILTVCCDVGGYAAGITIGRHLMAPAISPKKTWEGFGGSALFCLLGGAISLPVLLHGAVWQGLLLGAAALAAAALGDLVESMIKRDLEIKDMGSVLPGHGGILDRIDAMVITAPVTWLLLLVFVPVAR